MNQHILLFAKAPVSGQVKTRLTTDLTPDQAANIARQLLIHVMDACKTYQRHLNPACGLHLVGAPDITSKIWSELNADGCFHLIQQGQGDLGHRLNLASGVFLEKGEPVLCIGMDSPDLSPHHFDLAFNALSSVDVVLYPAFDGGYVLIGMKQHWTSLFKGIPWSTDQVLEKTLQECQRLGLEVWQGETLLDIDTPQDWYEWRDVHRENDAGFCSGSV